MGVLERNRRRKAKQQEPSPMPSAVGAQVETPASVPASGDVNTPDTMPVQAATSNPATPAVESRMVNNTPNVVTSPTAGLADAANVNLTIQQDNTPEWVKAGSYEDLVKINPNVSRAQYGYELSKYRRGQGLPDLTYQEWSNILKDQNPYETEAERLKRERNLRTAQQINALGSFLNALVNYNRVKRGHVGYTPDKGTEGYNRIERLRQGQQQLARANTQDYLGVITRDRAEKAKESAAAAAAQQKERDYQYKEARLKIDIENARSERERKAAADELARLKFKHQQDTDAAKLKETQRHNKATESISRDRAENGGGSDGIGSTATADDGTFMSRKKPLSKEEAYQIVVNTRDSEGYHEMFRKKTVTTNEDGQTVRTGDIDWEKMAAWLISQKKVPKSVLKNMGYKESKSEKQRDYSEYMEDDFSDLKE